MKSVHKILVTIGALCIFSIAVSTPLLWAQYDSAVAESKPSESKEVSDLKEALDPIERYSIFDDTTLLNGYTHKYLEEPKEVLVAMIQDDTLDDFRSAAAVRAFKEKYSTEVFSREKRILEKILIRRLNRTDSPFVEIEVMHTLCRMDRYKYFKSMVPALIQKLDHYNKAVNVLADTNLNEIIDSGHNRAREARIVFNTLRKVLFLSRKRLYNVREPDLKLSQKLKLVRWSIKILGNEQLKRLPKEVIPLL